jgi:hypothetical protein
VVVVSFAGKHAVNMQRPHRSSVRPWASGQGVRIQKHLHEGMREDTVLRGGLSTPSFQPYRTTVRASYEYGHYSCSGRYARTVVLKTKLLVRVRARTIGHYGTVRL